MPTQTETILSSEQRIGPMASLKCLICGAEALYVWPWPSARPGAYCSVHHTEAKHKLQVALGQANNP